MSDEAAYKLKLRIDVREVVNKIPVHLDTSADCEEAIALVSTLIRQREAAVYRAAADEAMRYHKAFEVYPAAQIELTRLNEYFLVQATRLEEGKDGLD